MAPPLMSPADVAVWLGTTTGVLANWRTAGGGPPFTKVGRSVRYQPERVQAWLDDNTHERTPLGAGAVPLRRAS